MQQTLLMMTDDDVKVTFQGDVCSNTYVLVTVPFPTMYNFLCRVYNFIGVLNMR
jgi:hypothetical protein